MIKERWYCCPKCGQKLFIVNNDAVIRGMKFKCKKCKSIINVSLEPKITREGT